jgi:hypothetical protein
MSRSRFSEGVLLGAIIGSVATYFLSGILTENGTSSGSSDGDTSDDKASKVNQTLESVEKGLDKLSKMVEDKKGK